MGVLTDLFVNSELEEYLCSICKNVLENPSMLEPCQHNYCKSCINRWITEGHNTCPLCIEAIAEKKPPQRSFLNLLNNLKLRCPFQVHGCASPILRLEVFLADHRQKCEFNPNTRRPCDQDCGAALKRAEREGHHCIAYLKEAIDALRTELAETKEEVETTRQQLIGTNFVLESREAELDEARYDADFISQQHDARYRKLVRQLKTTREELEFERAQNADYANRLGRRGIGQKLIRFLRSIRRSRFF